MYFKDIDFSKYSSIRIGQKESVLHIEKGDLIPKDRYLTGGANNLLISPKPPPLMKLGKSFAYMQIEGEHIVIGAAMPTGRVVSFAKKHDLAGFEFFAKLPGTLGGMLAMNAGVKSYEIFDILDEVEIEGEWIKRDEIEYGYRFAKLPGIATAAKFPLRRGFDSVLQRELAAMRSNQPSEPSAGSIFKNPKGDYAGRLIEAAGLKGIQRGAMAWSEMHANFLVNKGGGRYEDAIYLINLAKEKVYGKFGVELKEEVKILDNE